MATLKVFSVSEYIQHLNEVLYERDAVVEGEISEYKINQQKWIFFKVKDDAGVLECFATVFRVKIPLEDGMRVRIYGRPGIYPKSGRFSMNVEWVEPTGEGALKRAFELLKAELEKEGLFALQRKRALPRFPARIGLITSRESAAYGDFIKVLQQRFGGLSLHLYHTQVQGSEAVQNIVDAFSYFNTHQKELRLDCIVLIRGGGSLEDLASFNSREVAYAIFGSAVPVVTGVGHEQDESIADYVADLRASTPSNAAELIAPQRSDVARYIDAMAQRIEFRMHRVHDEATARVDSMVSAVENALREKMVMVDRMEQQVLFRLKFFEERIIMQQSKIEGFVRLMHSFSPRAVLDRGYAIVQKGGQAIASVKTLKIHDAVHIRLKDGAFEAGITHME